MYHVCVLASEEVKVVLTGQGADEPHAGYHRYLGESYGHYYRALPSVVRSAIAATVERLPRAERLKRATRNLGTVEASSRFAGIYAVFSDAAKQKLWRSSRQPKNSALAAAAAVAYWRTGIEDRDLVEQMAYVDARFSLADDLLHYGDRMSMAASVEARVPYLDLDYMRVAESLPARLRIRKLQRKYLHKQALAKWLPQSILSRPKRGFETPIDRWFRTELKNWIKTTLLSADAGCRLYFEPTAIEALVEEHASGRHDHRRQLFTLLAFELWHRQFIVGGAQSGAKVAAVLA
jgi:asparagine synthase (glutamine-hydrolysing)